MDEIKLDLPDGTVLRAVACPDPNYPAINLYWTNSETGLEEEICFAEYNPEQSPCHKLASVSINLIRTNLHITSHIRQKGILYEKQQSNQN